MAPNQKILLLDDNKDLLLVLQIILKGQGYEVVTAGSVEEAEKKIRIHQPTLALMDVFLGDEDGRSFCNQLKHDAATADTRVILMSGYDSSLGLLQGICADDFIQKPFDYDDLLQKVQVQMGVGVA